MTDVLGSCHLVCVTTFTRCLRTKVVSILSILRKQSLGRYMFSDEEKKGNKTIHWIELVGDDNPSST